MTSPEYQAPTWVNEDDPAFIDGVSPDLGAGYLNALSGAVEDHGQRLGAITPVVTYLNANAVTQDAGDNRWILQDNANGFAPAEATTNALAGKQPLDADLTALAGLDSATAGTVASDGAGWVKKTYAQLKSALGLGNVDNTSDANKPISTATQTALNAKASTSSLAAVATSGSASDITTGTLPDTVIPANIARDSEVVTQLAALPLRADNVTTTGAAVGQLLSVGQVNAGVPSFELVDTGEITPGDIGAQPADADLTAIAGLAPADGAVLRRVAGAWSSSTIAEVKTALTLTKGDVGLGNVDNTSDTAKPVSTAQQAALDGKADATVANATILPPVMAPTAAAATWSQSNRAVFAKFTLTSPTSLRYVNWSVVTASGNVQLGVVKLSGSDYTTFDRVMNSGVIACPAAGNIRTDLGDTTLQAGVYALFLWCDNNVMQTRIGTNSNITPLRIAANSDGLATGVAATGSLTYSTFYFSASIESAGVA